MGTRDVPFAVHYSLHRNISFLAIDAVLILHRRSSRPYSALYYYRARTYDPKVGRFLQTEPSGPTLDEMNAYVYVTNNPVNLRDPYGLFAMYGNWCGENWSGGGQTPPLPPIDSLDRLCMNHDLCYKNGRDNPECDRQLVSDCMELPRLVSQWCEPPSNPFKATFMRDAIISCFSDPTCHGLR